jgi:hypothetical protein
MEHIYGVCVDFNAISSMGTQKTMVIPKLNKTTEFVLNTTQLLQWEVKETTMLLKLERVYGVCVGCHTLFFDGNLNRRHVLLKVRGVATTCVVEGKMNRYNRRECCKKFIDKTCSLRRNALNIQNEVVDSICIHQGKSARMIFLNHHIGVLFTILS